MNMEIRLYKRHDTDIIALCDAGYPVAAMMKNALCGYAHGTPVHYYIDQYVPFSLKDKVSTRTRFSIPEQGKKTCYLLRNIKHTYRNSFCKMVFRNALIQQNLAGYFADTSLVHLQSVNMGGRPLYQFQNVIPCSTLTRSAREVTFLGRTVREDLAEATNYSDILPTPFSIDPGYGMMDANPSTSFAPRAKPKAPAPQGKKQAQMEAEHTLDAKEPVPAPVNSPVSKELQREAENITFMKENRVSDATDNDEDLMNMFENL